MKLRQLTPTDTADAFREDNGDKDERMPVEAPTTADRREVVARPDAAIEALTNGQQQADMDGTFVKVSRQALDDTLAYIAMIATATGEA